MNRRNSLQLIWVAAGGAVGAVLRYLTEVLIALAALDTYLFTPVIFVNITGSFFIGMLYYGFTKGKLYSLKLELFFITGLVASFTTYSGFGVESLEIFREFGFIFLIYIIVQFVLGILSLLLGIRTGKMFFTK